MPYDLTPFRGIFPAGLTCFDVNGELDEGSTAEHWEWLINQGVQGLVVAGTSGEFIALETEERIRLFHLATAVTRGRVPVVMGAGHYSTRQTIRMAEAAQKAGADALIIILPYYQRPTKTGVIQHFAEIRRATQVPIMLYNNPGNSACVDLSPREIARLAEEDVIHMVKSTYETVVPVHDLDYLAGDRIAIFYGSFLAALEGLLAGAHGWISGILNVIPGAAIEMHRKIAHDNDARGARDVWRRILPLIHVYVHQLLGPVNDLAIYRSMLKIWGLKGGFSRRPFLPLTPEQENQLKELMSQWGWLQPEFVRMETEKSTRP
jgi:4-hydroxy-tetrahydrodipicolinate synthase